MPELQCWIQRAIQRTKLCTFFSLFSTLFPFCVFFFFPSFFSHGCRPFEPTNGPSGWRHWNVNEPSACSRRSESLDCLLSSLSHAPGPGVGGKNHTAGAGPRHEKRAFPPKRRVWVGCVLGRVLKKRSAAKVWVRSARGV